MHARCADPGRHLFGDRADPIHLEDDSELMLVLVLVLEPRDHGRIGQRRGVPERLAFGDVAQQAAHDLAGARLRQIGRENHIVGARNRADLLDDVILQLADQDVGPRACLPST